MNRLLVGWLPLCASLDQALKLANGRYIPAPPFIGHLIGSIRERAGQLPATGNQSIRVSRGPAGAYAEPSDRPLVGLLCDVSSCTDHRRASRT